MKILHLFQKASEKNQSGDADASILSESDIAQLFKEVSIIETKEIKKIEQ